MKCIQYWPENSETNQFETVDVAHQETLEFEDHVERTFSLRHKKVIMAYFTAETVHSCLVGHLRPEILAASNLGTSYKTQMLFVVSMSLHA